MTDTPYVTLSSAISLDGYLDTAGPPRLTLSNAADLDRVDAVRARNDAILVGARTVRRDNPRLLVRSSARQLRREEAGLPLSPWKVTVTATGDLDPHAAFFTTGETTRLVYCPASLAESLRRRLGPVAVVVGLNRGVRMTDLVEDLGGRGIGRLMVEGGAIVHTQFLAADLVDELHLCVAPFFVGAAGGARFVGNAVFPWTSDRRATLAEARQIGDMVLLRYALSDRFTEQDAGPQHPVDTARLLAGTR